MEDSATLARTTGDFAPLVAALLDDARIYVRAAPLHIREDVIHELVAQTIREFDSWDPARGKFVSRWKVFARRRVTALIEQHTIPVRIPRCRLDRYRKARRKRSIGDHAAADALMAGEQSQYEDGITTYEWLDDVENTAGSPDFRLRIEGMDFIPRNVASGLLLGHTVREIRRALSLSEADFDAAVEVIRETMCDP